MLKKRFFLFPLLLLSISSCGGGGEASSSSDSFFSSLDGASNEASSDEESSSSLESASESETASSKQSSSSSSSDSEDDETGAFSGVVRVYFHDDGNTVATKRIYTWITGVDGTEYNWDGEEEGYGMYKDTDLSDAKFSGKVTDDFYFIIKFPLTWTGQSADIKITLSDYLSNGEVDTLEDGRKRINVFAADEGGGNIATYYHKADALGDRFSSCYLNSDWKTISVTCTGPCASYNLYALDATFAAQNVSLLDAKLDSYLIDTGSPSKSAWTIDLSKLTYASSGKTVEIKPSLTYAFVGHFEDAPEKTKTKCVSFDKIYDTQKFIDEYTYDGDDLGVTYSSNVTQWKVWSPISVKADLLLYKYGTPNAQVIGAPGFNDIIFKTVSMRPDSKGVYVGSASGDFAGWYYLYRLYYNGWYVDTPDPYATSCGVNGLRSGVIDFAATDPKGWDDVSFPTLNSPNELTVYEVHIRDLTSHSTWKSRKGNENGSYNAFHEAGTGYNGVTTGFDHIKELGVNAVQILPFFDQDNDERTTYDAEGNAVKPSYNWGYNPENYNCLEGSYSSDPYNAPVRVKEFKALVKDYADAGIRIIMDVVYNHVSSVSSSAFSSTMPRYYFRYASDGSLIDDTGCANTFNSSRVMASRYIVNSVKWWASKYKIKGFRFDLMGCIETDTMRAVKDALYDIDPEIVVYGEGWTGSGSHAVSASDTQNVYAKLGDNGKGAVGAFNDCYRDGMKGNTTYGNITPSGGFMNATSPSENEIWNAATGMIGENRWKKSSGVATPASMTVNYLTCHDNYTLYDQLNYLLHGASNCLKDYDDVKDAALASTVNSLMGEGIGFMQGGEEFFRSKVICKGDKYFDSLVSSVKANSNGTSSWIEGDGIKINGDAYLVRNSYKYGDDVNGFDWSRKVSNEDYFIKFKEAVALRNSSMGNYLGLTQAQVESRVTCLGGSAIGGAFKGSDGKMRIVITSGRKAGDVNNIASSFLGSYKVVYCSSSRLAVGSSYEVNSTSGLARNFETLVLEK